MNKKNLIIFGAFIMAVVQIMAMDIEVTNDIKDIAATNKMGVRLTFNANVQAVLCSTINFSIDNPQINVVDWTSTQRPISQFLTTFKRSKKVFTESFNCDISIKSNSSNLVAELKTSNIHLFCVIQEHNGRTKSVNICCPINYETEMANTGQQDNTFDTTTSTYTSNIQPNIESKKISYNKMETEPGNIIVDKFKDLWTFLQVRIDRISDKIDFYILYLVIIVLMILFMLLIVIYPPVKNMFGGGLRLLIFAFITMSYFFTKSHLIAYKFYIVLAGLLMLIAFYYIFSAKTESARDKLKSLLGFILAAAAIPLILKAFLLFNNLG